MEGELTTGAGGVVDGAPPGGVPLTEFKLIVPEDWDAFLKTHKQFVTEWNKMVGMR